MIRIDSEEDGFYLTVTDDEDTGGPLTHPGVERIDSEYDVVGYRMKITDPEHLYELVKKELGPPRKGGVMRRLTDEIQEEMRERRAAGETLREIGDVYGCSYEAVRLVTLGVAPPPHRKVYRRVFRVVAVAARHQKRADNGGSLSPHGSGARYQHGCKCDECLAGNRARVYAYRGKTPPRHGTANAYKNYGCRCDLCKRAGSEANFYTATMRHRRAALKETYETPQTA